MMCKDCKKRELCKFYERAVQFIAEMNDLNKECPDKLESNPGLIGAMFYCNYFEPATNYCDSLCGTPYNGPCPISHEESIWANGLHYPMADPPPFNMCREMEQSRRYWPNGPQGPLTTHQPPFHNTNLLCGCSPRTHKPGGGK